jgi:glutathione S-transferase
MKLVYTQTSPFVRKVLGCAHELGVPLDTMFLRPSPLKPDPDLSRMNPLSKIPALLLDSGMILYDSPVICEYLDTTYGPRLIPAAGPERWRVLRDQALADGILDAGVLVYYERTQRPAERHWEPWIAGQTAKVLQGLDALEAEVEHFGRDVDVAQIAAGAALAWLEFRNVVGDIRASRAKLFGWYDAFAERPSMQATRPS